ncbi:MAG TPA: ATP-binding protein, partial [Herpetosiphonaceae bacterium]
LGMLASGIAHDLNNILTIAKGNVELALMDLEAGSDHLLTKYLATADVATQRASDLARQILAYSNKQPAATQSAQINEIVAEMDELLGVSIRKQISLEYQLRPEVPAVEVNVTQIRQVLMNLIINAGEAIGANRGVIRLATGLLDARDPWLRAAYPGAAGAFVFAEVADTGCGMDEATLSAIFEPFFTTKQTGCGLGLAAAQGIVQAHGGMIWVSSALGAGTTFRILLPCAGTARPVAACPGDGDGWRCGGTVLVVDDEVSVRQTVGAMLEKLGFDVVFADGGLAGLRAIAAAPDLIKLVVMDITMAGLTGLETLELIRKHAATLPVVLMSGSLLPSSPGVPAAAPALRFLQKPLSFADLRAVLPELLPAGA